MQNLEAVFILVAESLPRQHGPDLLGRHATRALDQGVGNLGPAVGERSNGFWAVYSINYSRVSVNNCAWASAGARIADSARRYPALPNIYHARAEKSINPNDMTHVLVVNYIYELPFGHGKLFLTNANRIPNKIVGGWSISGITSMHSGRPFVVSNTPATSFSMAGVQRPNRVAGVSPDPTAAELAKNIFINAAAFSAPAPCSAALQSLEFRPNCVPPVRPPPI